jgi:ligand-binding sensor domain-containing protein/DNA-binding CsgD family transcriptional regulator
MRITPFVFLSLLLFNISTVTAQIKRVGSPSITNFSRSDYQAGTQNWAIQQDDKGILYFANNKGLLEFDGTNWLSFPLPNGTIVRSVNFDKSGKIYIGGQDEVGYLEANENGKRTYTSLTHLFPKSFKSFEDIWKIFIQDDNIYFCSEKAVFLLQGDQLQVIKPRSQRFENFFEKGNRIFVQDFGEGLFEIKNSQLLPISNSNIFLNERIIAILPHDNNQSLVFTFSKGLYLMKDAEIRPWDAGANDFLKTHQAYCAIELNDGKYAIGTPQNGLIIINRNGELEMHLNKNKGLQNNTILCIIQDTQQNLWLGMDNGIDYAEINSPFSKIRTQEGITGTGYASIAHNGKLYLGTNQGLYFMDWQEGNSNINNAKFRPVKNGLGQVWNINKVNDGIIVGQHKGTSYLDKNEIVPFSNVQGAWKFLALKSNPAYAIGGTYSGLYLYIDQNYNPNNNKLPKWKLEGKIKGFDESARIFEEDSEGVIWVSHTYKGLYKISLTEDLREVKKLNLFSGSNGLPNELIINVVKIRNELVFTTPKGIFKYDNSTNQFIPHQDFIKIFGEKRNFRRLVQDNLGNIWFSVDNEFGVIKEEEEGVFNKFKVLYFNQIQEDLVDGFEHIYAYDENNVFIGTEKGFVHYSPLKKKDTEFSFKILIRKVTSITHSDSTFYWGNPTSENFNFHYKMNDFRFAFSAPYYEKISYLKYRFKLEGFENTWTDWSTKTEKEYTNLPAGEYHFKVQARNAYGQLSNEDSFDFKISPPWYWSWYAKIGYLLLGLLGLYSLIKLISKKEEKKTEAFKKEQTEKLELKEVEFKKEVEKSEGEIIKLRNDKLNTDINHKNSQLASATMHLVQKSEILMKIKNDLTNLQSDASHDIKRKIQQITRVIESDIQLDDNWEQFETYFDQVHENFFKRLRKKYPELTPKDQKLCAYLRMNLTTKEIAPLLNISVRGVEISRYRLRKKLGLNSDVNLVAFILEV